MGRIMRKATTISLTFIFVVVCLFAVNRGTGGHSYSIGANVARPNVDKLFGKQELGQTFVANHVYLPEIAINTDPQRIPADTVFTVRLFEVLSRTDIPVAAWKKREITLASQKTGINPDGSGWQTIRFNGVHLKTGHTYYFTVSRKGGSGADKIFWHGSKKNSYYYGKAVAGGRPANYDFMFQTVYQVSLKELYFEFWRGEGLYKPVLSPLLLLLAMGLLLGVFGLFIDETISYFDK
jgi:hypothetical protein